jgi:aryl-alcohol dehydrogenase-like predicted oxidoreductase
MIDRRQWIGMTLAAGAALGFGPRLAIGAPREPLLSRPIPSSGERVPVIGLGSSATFRAVAEREDVASLRDVLSAMVERGAAVFDTAPSYGASEAVAGRLARELGVTQQIFWATKVNVAARGGGAADFDAASWAQFFIKYVLGHPAVTVVTPATSQACHMIENLGGGIGRLPDTGTRKRMAEFIDALPVVSR